MEESAKSSKNLLSELLNICKHAGKAILEIYHDEGAFEQIDAKADQSPLTLADKAAHQIISDHLQQLAIVYPILSEEGKHLSYEERKAWDRFWLVDPLDGTKEFIKRNGEFTVNIALIENGHPVIGCVHIPVSGKTYLAEKNNGAQVVEKDGEIEDIHVSSFSLADKGLRIVCSRSHMSKEVEAYVGQFKDAQTLSMGSSLKFMLVAEGKADIYPRLAPTMEWDTAAAQIVVEEAGGMVIRHDTQEPMTYNKENLLNPHFIAFGKKKA